jgi:LysM repeat protein
LFTIAEAYHISVERILTLNGLQPEWPLQIGQKLVISPGNITPSPTLSAIQKLTPEIDGSYYHTVRSGETLFWIAGLYKVPLSDLMAWNGLNNTSVIRPDQKLILLVTPPVTPTATQAPSPTVLTPSPSMTQPPPTGTPAVTDSEPPMGLNPNLFIGVAAIMIVTIGGLLWRRLSRNRHKTT